MLRLVDLAPTCCTRVPLRAYVCLEAVSSQIEDNIQVPHSNRQRGVCSLRHYSGAMALNEMYQEEEDMPAIFLQGCRQQRRSVSTENKRDVFDWNPRLFTFGSSCALRRDTPNLLIIFGLLFSIAQTGPTCHWQFAFRLRHGVFGLLRALERIPCS